jgi:hypothetical protein
MIVASVLEIVNSVWVSGMVRCMYVCDVVFVCCESALDVVLWIKNVNEVRTF